MLGINYASSDEEEDVPQVQSSITVAQSNESGVVVESTTSRVDGTGSNADRSQNEEDRSKRTTPIDSIQIPGPPRPQAGPTLETAQPATPSRGARSLPEDDPRPSPYSKARAAIQSMTMPLIPNFEIPPSPPDSPPAAATKKFDHFLKLKAQGVHFNEKLANSTQLRNPSLFEKLVDFAGIDDKDQYASALPKDLAVVTEFPPWAFADQLNRKQAEMLKRKNEGKKGRQAVDFVAGNAGESSKGVPSILSSDRKRPRSRSPDR